MPKKLTVSETIIQAYDQSDVLQIAHSSKATQVVTQNTRGEVIEVYLDSVLQ